MDKNSVLLDASNIFMENGIKSITMDDIAKRLKISKRTLYEYFDTKSNLIFQIVRYNIKKEKEIIDHHINTSANSIEIMINVSKSIIQMYNNSHDSVLHDIKKYYKRVWQIIEDFHNDHINKLVYQNLKNGINEGLYRPEINPKILAALYTIQLRLFSSMSNFNIDGSNFKKLKIQFFEYHMYGIMSTKGIKYYKNYENK